jgi:NNP family nitrate/nitrite transporter-like MFS transporter
MLTPAIAWRSATFGVFRRLPAGLRRGLLGQWLIPYYVNAYGLSVATAGMMATIRLPGGVIRSAADVDHWGARRDVLVLGGCTVCCTADRRAASSRPAAACSARGDSRRVSTRAGGGRWAYHPLRPEARRLGPTDGAAVFCGQAFWHEPTVKVGDRVMKRQLLARASPTTSSQRLIFSAIVLVVGF